MKMTDRLNKRSERPTDKSEVCSDCFVPYRIACNIQCPRVYEGFQYIQDNSRKGSEISRIPRPYESN